MEREAESRVFGGIEREEEEDDDDDEDEEEDNERCFPSRDSTIIPRSWSVSESSMEFVRESANGKTEVSGCEYGIFFSFSLSVISSLSVNGGG